jgi:transposase
LLYEKSGDPTSKKRCQREGGRMQREIEELGMRVWWCGRKKEREGNGARNLSKRKKR